MRERSSVLVVASGAAFSPHFWFLKTYNTKIQGEPSAKSLICMPECLLGEEKFTKTAKT